MFNFEPDKKQKKYIYPIPSMNKEMVVQNSGWWSCNISTGICGAIDLGSQTQITDEYYFITGHKSL